ncbi:Nuclear transcription factor Y subunit B-2 [Platanthera guangdongensis]|uniref:Nuclear transcription factor Y subunit B-2 n=1 Tax=Platanthera guangdongensis TaxID=2320717 RepID=A0ABR2MDM6_9ASPA
MIEFISFNIGEPSDKCLRAKPKTTNDDDLLWAMATLGFSEYVEHLNIYLQKFREMEGKKGVDSSQTHRDDNVGLFWACTSISFIDCLNIHAE